MRELNIRAQALKKTGRGANLGRTGGKRSPNGLPIKDANRRRIVEFSA